MLYIVDHWEHDKWKNNAIFHKWRHLRQRSFILVTDYEYANQYDAEALIRTRIMPFVVVR